MNIKEVENLTKSDLLNIFEKNNASANGIMKKYVGDVFYDFSRWPEQSLRDFWLIRRMHRLRLTNFCFGNGISPDVFFDIVQFYHDTNDDNKRRIREMKDLWQRLIDGPPSQYYFYSMELGFEIYFNNERRKYGCPAGQVQFGNLFRSVDADQSSPSNFREEIRTLGDRIRADIAEFQNKNAEHRQQLFRRCKERTEIFKHLKIKSLKGITDLFLDDEEDEKNKDKGTNKSFKFLGLSCIDDLFSDDDNN